MRSFDQKKGIIANKFLLEKYAKNESLINQAEVNDKFECVEVIE